MSLSEILSFVTLFVVFAVVIGAHIQKARSKEASRLCVTLRQNEGEFIGLLVEKSRKRWTFEHCQLMPLDKTESPIPVDGRLHVPHSNILYYQQLSAKEPGDAGK